MKLNFGHTCCLPVEEAFQKNWERLSQRERELYPSVMDMVVSDPTHAAELVESYGFGLLRAVRHSVALCFGGSFTSEIAVAYQGRRQTFAVEDRWLRLISPLSPARGLSCGFEDRLTDLHPLLRLKYPKKMDRLDLNGTGVRDLSPCYLMSNLRDIRCHGDAFTHREAKYHPGLTYLSLYDGTPQVSAIAKLRELRTLAVSYSKGPIDLTLLEGCLYLQYVSIRNAPEVTGVDWLRGRGVRVALFP